ncbi:hypothetical protein GALMADRAFT_256813 [Galerina marginata CBS 339.88]|uniref:DUF6535 domain-containing protein n=1 Tax=Galerina marginata (strain CBS 339.88) TaxID=685588 RepID=A0A067SEX5_GALM3|nr:hypothetical protein GALMADRAFT_256813 [Galerina marginata CBS 339.88]
MLQRDPNDAIISLLSVIANRLDNTTIPTPVLLSSTGPGSSFSPTTSSIRINNFWFISLVLSLATVLVGIISLQWIREHQNYPNLPPRECFALFNMRADGLKRWHVPKIFTALPLLLQSALVLFLSGIVDFLLSFGDIAVTIPVSVVTVLVLLFLVATTVLPALQSILLYIPYPYTRTSKIPPPQCPYKSPQAHAFRAILSSVIQLCHKIRFRTGENLQSTYLLTKVNFAIFIMITWTQKTWTEFDLAWVRLRDQFVQRSYNCLTNRELYNLNGDFPVFDLTRAFMEFRNSRDFDHIENSLSAQYYCFAEVSKWIIDRDIITTEATVLVQTNQHLWNIMGFNEFGFFDSLSDFCDITTRVEPSFAAILRFSSLLHQENMVAFLQRLERFHSDPVDFDKVFKNHMLELATRLSGVLYNDEYGHRATADFPSCLSMLFYDTDNNTDILFWQWVNNFSTFFQSAAHIQQPYTPGGTLHTHRGAVRHVRNLAFVDLQTTFGPAEGHVRQAIQRKFLDTFQMIAENLNEPMSSPDFREPSLLFYLTAEYLRNVNSIQETYPMCLNALLAAMQTYKARTIDAGVVNRDLEDIYGREIDWTGFEKYSPIWWDGLKDALNLDLSC